MNILVVEDAIKVASFIQRGLEASQYQVHVEHDGEAGLNRLLVEDYDLVILDVMLPKMDGFSVLKAMRKQGVKVPVLLLTARGAVEDKVAGLNVGADDYLTKPFSFQELLAHIKSILRRVQWDQSLVRGSQWSIGQVTLNLAAHRAFKAGVELTLRNKEYELLSLLMQQSGKVLTREVLFNQIWGTDWLGDTRTLDVHIRWLRQKIEDDPAMPIYIQTVRNVGYRFAAAEEI
jgi:DNA-binding response OmpR family regulator